MCFAEAASLAVGSSESFKPGRNYDSLRVTLELLHRFEANMA